jgi:GNAT superfamily N-acetyltransferase
VGGLEQYVAPFRERAASLGAELVEEPGLLAFGRRVDDRPCGRLLVFDDRSVEKLPGLLGSLDIDLVTVLGTARQSLALLEASDDFRPAEQGVAMVRPDLDDLPALPLPEGLRLTRVQRTADEPAGVSFDDAVAAAIAFDPDPEGLPEQSMRDFLLGLPRGRLLVGVDDDGAIHATSASGVFGSQAVVVMVSTNPEWRRQGVGSAMTAAALEAARENGAVQASLDASELGEPIYRRLGFTVVDRMSRFSNES